MAIAFSGAASAERQRQSRTCAAWVKIRRSAGLPCLVMPPERKGEEIRVTCDGEYTVMVFCYSLEGECGQNAPKAGDLVCLANAPDGSAAQKTTCEEDPCCIPCPDAKDAK
ncbi:MAG: hypothetical protein R3B72_38965 [Polyangiaceae bacterium]